MATSLDSHSQSSRSFAKPAVEEVRAYCVERGNTVDAEAFLDFYESKGWKIGRAPMRHWKAAVRTWKKREATKPFNGARPFDADPRGNFSAGRLYLEMFGKTEQDAGGGNEPTCLAEAECR